jgi:hypothetical protein
MSGGDTEALKWPDAEVPSGSENRANACKGHPGTWEVSLSPCLRERHQGYRDKKPLARGQKRRDAAREQKDTT